MSIKHPDFPHISVYSLPSAEAPKRGAFYAVRKGDTLSSIVSSLTKSGQWSGSTTANIIAAINNSTWNRATCIYRTDSSNCLSKKVTSGGYISLCQGDTNATARTLGNKYPVIWIPSAEYPNPSDVPVPAGPTPITPVGPTPVEPVVTPVGPEKSNTWLWVGVAIAVVAVGGILYMTIRKR